MLSKTSVYLIRALVELAKLPPNTYSGAANIAKKIGSPQNYLTKTLKILVQNQILASQKGFGGGVRLARDASDITLAEVIEPIENFEQQPHCIMGQHRCSEKYPCALHNQWKKIRGEHQKMLENTTIGAIVNFYKNKDYMNGLYEKITN